MTTTIYLIRHGHYKDPEKILPLRLPGFPLSETGKHQGRTLAKYFKDKHIVAVYTSRMTRAYMTARLIADELHIPVKINRKLLEIRSPLQGKSSSFIHKISGDFYNSRYIRAGGEKLETVFRRMDQVIRAISRRHRGQSVVAISHGDPIMSVWTRYSGLPLPKHYVYDEWYVPMAGGFKITIENGVPVHILKLPLP